MEGLTVCRNSGLLGGKEPRDRSLKTLSGLGSAPLDEKAIAWYLENAIPGDGGIRAVPVPGAVVGDDG